MNIIKNVKMTPEQFADYLLSHQWKENECIEFALTDQSTEDVQDFTDWWFCTRVTYPGYISDNILLDYCGGGYPHAFSLDDEELFKELIVEYFTKFNDDWNETDGINVDIKEED